MEWILEVNSYLRKRNLCLAQRRIFFLDLPSLCSDHDFVNLMNEIQSSEELASELKRLNCIQRRFYTLLIGSSSDHDEISELLYDGLEEPRSIEPSDTADCELIISKLMFVSN